MKDHDRIAEVIANSAVPNAEDVYKAWSVHAATGRRLAEIIADTFEDVDKADIPAMTDAVVELAVLAGFQESSARTKISQILTGGGVRRRAKGAGRPMNPEAVKLAVQVMESSPEDAKALLNAAARMIVKLDGQCLLNEQAAKVWAELNR